MESSEHLEKKQSSTSLKNHSSTMTLDKVVELGEYRPEFLAQFPEWYTFSRHVKFEYIRRALDNRNRQLISQWAEITNVLDFRLKPHLNEALINIEEQLQALKRDKELLYVEYSK